MASTYMGYYTPADGADAGTWGASVNSDLTNFIDLNFAGPLALSLSSSNVLLTAAQARNQMIRMTGTLLASVVISPDTGVLWNGIKSFENITTGSFTVTFANSAGSVVIPQGRRGTVFFDTTNGPRITGMTGSTAADPVPTGSVMPFYNSAAPSGWTAQAINDYNLKVVSSSGGVLSGSVAYSTLFGRTTTDSHTLTIAQMPSHTHTADNATIGGTSGFAAGAGGSAVPGGAVPIGLAFTGGGNGHTHNIDMRVQTAAVILCARN